MGAYPPFAKAFGLDLVIRPAGEVVLIELQHHFGRRGLREIYPDVSRKYRKLLHRLRSTCGVIPAFNDALRKVCVNKITTYRALPDFQPRSRVYLGWRPSVEKWLAGLSSEYVLSKPPRGSCGRGIHVYPRLEIGPETIPAPPGGQLLLQEYVESKPLYDGDGLPHVGCIRHIMIIAGNGAGLAFFHLPPYWRVSPAPFVGRPERPAFTANISRGATAAPVERKDSLLVERAAEGIASALVASLMPRHLVSGPEGAGASAGRFLESLRMEWAREMEELSERPHVDNMPSLG